VASYVWWAVVPSAIAAYSAYSILTGTDSIPPQLRTVADGRIEVLDASYGKICKGAAVAGNATLTLRRACNGLDKCSFPIDVRSLGDPAGGCRKDFVVRWRCGQKLAPREMYIGAEAHGQSLELGCEERP
jgi:hypothetical protein